MEESHQGNKLSNPTEWEKWTLNDNDDVSIIHELGHMFGQALAQWRAISLAATRSSMQHLSSRSGHLRRCCMVCSDVLHSQAVSAASTERPITQVGFSSVPCPGEVS